MNTPTDSLGHEAEPACAECPECRKDIASDLDLDGFCSVKCRNKALDELLLGMTEAISRAQAPLPSELADWEDETVEAPAWEWETAGDRAWGNGGAR